ncbi:chaperonin-like RBCX protein 1, chloroplastic [Silene latifolia]|uniref:chaperonin-like RBCX protein 1, chloroplastic n=1 Tax=Silene latifolia TaxID=37657 RepID=UPI003D76A48E
MESSAIFSLSPPSFLNTITPNKTKVTPLSLWNHKRNSHPSNLHCNKMFVPGFGEASPEAKAASNLHHFFTYVAVKIVAAQLESYNPEAHTELMEFLSRNSLTDGDKFCADMMRESPHHKNLALRILEVRSAYCKNDFEWDNLRRVALKMVDDSNTKIMRDYVVETSHET